MTRQVIVGPRVMCWSATSLRLGGFAAGLLSLCGCLSRTVIIQSTPPNASVVIDGKEVGMTPATRNLTWSEDTVHSIGVALDEYEKETQQLSYLSAKQAPLTWTRDFALKRIAHTVDVRVTTEPAGAVVSVNGQKAGNAPVTVPVRFSRSSSRDSWGRAKFETALEEYFPERFDVEYPEKDTVSYQLELKRATDELDVRIETVPPGATISLDSKSVGTSPLTLPIRFARSSTTSAWGSVAAGAELPDHQPARHELTYAEGKGGRVEMLLPRIREEIPVAIRTNFDPAYVEVDGKAVGQTPLSRRFVFTRREGSSPWSSFGIVVSKEGYRWHRSTGAAPKGDTSPFSTTLTLDEARGGELQVELEPVRFHWTILRTFNFDGEVPALVEERYLAQVFDVEKEPLVKSVTRITDRAAGELMDTRLWVSAAAQQLVYSVPFSRSEESTEVFNNLWSEAGQGMTRLTDGDFSDIHAAVSGDGQLAYFSANRLVRNKWNIWRVQMTGQGGFTKLTDSPTSAYDLMPSSSPDGSRIAYMSRLRGAPPRQWQVWTANADGTLPTQLRSGINPAWSPDAKQLTYVAVDDEDYKQIWVMNTDGSRPTQLTAGRTHRDWPVWTPDGTRIVYTSNEAVNAEGEFNDDIWIMNRDGTDRTQLTVNGSRDFHPAISPDGKFIYFLSNRGPKKSKSKTEEENWQIWRIELLMK